MNEVKFVITSKDVKGMVIENDTDNVMMANALWDQILADKDIRQARMVVVTTIQLASLARA